MFSALGPELHALAARMRDDPEGARMLREKPDLGMTLADRRRLAALPEGSLGRAYLEFMSGADVLPGYMLGGLAYTDGALDQLVDWDADAKYVVERLGNAHDMTHVLGGYGSDLCGEAVSIPFQLCLFGVPLRFVAPFARSWGQLTAPLLLPSVGVSTWVALCAEGAARGAAMAQVRPGTQVRFEELLPLPLDVVRAQLGIPAHTRCDLVSPTGWLLSGTWSNSRFAASYATGFGQAEPFIEFGRRVAPLVEQGVSVRELMRVPRTQAWQAVERFEHGASLVEVRAALA